MVDCRAVGGDYLIPPGTGAANLIERLQARMALEREPPVRAERAYFDTFDGRVRASGGVLVHERGRLVLIDAASGRELAYSAVDRRPGTVVAGDVGGRLARVLDLRAASVVARVRVRTQRLRVLDGERKTVVRLLLEEPAVDGTPLPGRLRVLGVRGYDKHLRRVRRVLERDVGLAPAPVSLADEVVAASGGAPGGFSSKLDVRLDPEQPADIAAAAIGRRLLEIIDANLPGTLAGTDTEFLHDLRVAVRRTRALQRELRGVFPAGPLAAMRAEFRHLQQVTGPTRDLDVQLLDFDQLAGDLRPQLEPLHRLLVGRAGPERARMVGALRSSRTRRALSGWRTLLDELPARPTGDRPDAARPTHELAGERIRRVYRRMVRMGEAVDDTTPPEALHDLRKKGKELRYLLEFFGGLFDEREVKPMVRALKDLQDVLGRFQDRQVQVDTLRALGDELADADGGAGALMAVGVLVERLHDQSLQARTEFAARFTPFAATERRRAARRTFR